MIEEKHINLPARDNDGHKGTFGTVCVLGGQAVEPHVMIGGPALAAAASLRVGCGLSLLAMPAPLLGHGLTLSPSSTGLSLPVGDDDSLDASATAEVLDTWLPRCGCLVAGPGLGRCKSVGQVMISLVAQEDVPLVLDADAINALADIGHTAGDLRAPAVWTPHPGEFQRLATSLGIDCDPVDPSGRSWAAEMMAQRLGSVVVLKGPRTVISDGQTTIVNETGNACLATAGTGDVLSGLIGGLIAQFYKPHLGVGGRQITPLQQGGLCLLSCAALGVRIHGLAADRWARAHGQSGMLAGDLLSLIPDVMDGLRHPV